MDICIFAMRKKDCSIQDWDGPYYDQGDFGLYDTLVARPRNVSGLGGERDGMSKVWHAPRGAVATETRLANALELVDQPTGSIGISELHRAGEVVDVFVDLVVNEKEFNEARLRDYRGFQVAQGRIVKAFVEELASSLPADSAHRILLHYHSVIIDQPDIPRNVAFRKDAYHNPGFDADESNLESRAVAYFNNADSTSAFGELWGQLG